MSVKMMGAVWDTVMSPNEKLVLLAYADHADHKGNNIFPSIKLISSKTGYSERQVQRITKLLEQKGYLVTDGVGPYSTNKWKLGGDKLSGGGDTHVTRGVTPMSPEPLIKPSLNNNNKGDGENQEKYYSVLGWFYQYTYLPIIMDLSDKDIEVLWSWVKNEIIEDDIKNAVSYSEKKGLSIVNPSSLSKGVSIERAKRLRSKSHNFDEKTQHYEELNKKYENK